MDIFNISLYDSSEAIFCLWPDLPEYRIKNKPVLYQWNEHYQPLFLDNELLFLKLKLQ